MARQGTPLIAVLCLLITACGTFHVPTGTAVSSSRSSTPPAASAARVASEPRLSSPCPTPRLPTSFPPSPASSRNLVIAKLRGSDQTVIRDITDIDHPATIGSVQVSGWGLVYGEWGNPAFVTPTTISFKAVGQLMRSPISGPAGELIRSACGAEYIVAFQWSPDGQSFAYVFEPADWPGTFDWHLVSRGVDRVIGTAPASCHCGEGSEDFSIDTGFSPDGQFVWLIDYLGIGTDLQVRRLDGSLIGTEIRGGRNDPNPLTWGVWSGSDFLFRDSAGVKRWREGVIAPFLPGIAWLHPRTSPNGGQVVYAVRGPDEKAHVYVVDTSNGRTRQLSSQPRTWPFFLNSRYVWYRGERACGPDNPCMGATKATFSGTTYIYDLQTGIESESIITEIADVWPHGA